ncbi:DUF4876 domain-containing protein [Bacteroidia bacterium]|nr:DUF4876 domain-containing protein [Bacteroidia bacterium]
MNKNIIQILFILTFMSVMQSCLKTHLNGDESTLKLDVKAIFDTENTPEGIDITAITCVVSNIKETSLIHRKNLDSAGNIEFLLSPGSYSIVMSAEFVIDNNVYYINGAVSDFLLDEKGVSMKSNSGYQEPVINVEMLLSKSSALIIREVYYAGSKNINTGENYSRDQYIEIYNNSNSIVYLDSLFIGCMYPYNSISGSHPFAGYDTTPIADKHWMFPGDGNDYPLNPGESVVIAECAIEHTESDLHLHLEKSHFAFYASNLNTQKDPSVVALKCMLETQSNRYTLSISCPAVVIYKIPNVKEYYANPTMWCRFEPGRSAGRQDWCIPQSWILDGVEIFEMSGNNTKRLRGYVDASYCTLTAGRNIGLAVSRKIEKIVNGKNIYKDSNNSIDDFEEKIATPTLRNQ